MSVAVEEKKDPIAKFGSQVDEQIAQATGRIRVHDLTLGALTLGALAASYATAMILLDKYLNLPEWVRQLSLAGFVLANCGIAYFLLVRPLRQRINPLYAAARVEKTIDDAKNSVTGYVEAQEKGEVHSAVKAAMGARAAKAVGEADVNRAVDHRSLIVAGGILLVFLLTLAVLFFVFRPSQFTSLVNRALFPFSSDPIAKRTQLMILKPEPADPTITTGQTITVAVHVGGKVPAKNAPDRVRVLLRHTLADPNFEEIAMEQGETSRDWQVKVPEYLVQNGFWYKVAAGDAETPEYHITVRTIPQFDEYEATYIYPAYTRKPNDKSTGPNIRAYKGTKVTLIAKTNREVKDGVMKFEAAHLEPIAGKPVPGKPDSLEFKFTAAEATRYRLHMNSTTGERNTDPPAFPIVIDSDMPPSVIVTKPEEAESTAVANGQLKVDGTVGDDFGIDKVRLCMRIDGRDLAPVPYMDGQSFLRKKDNTWPTSLEFKLSADLTKLTYVDGTNFAPRFGGEKPPVIEFWVEAIDNCSEAKPVADWNNQVGNVGRSNVQKLRLTPPEMEPEKKQELDDQKQQRGNEEKQHNQDQQNKLNNEERKKPEPKDGKEPPQKQDGQPQTKNDNDPNAKKGMDNTGMGGMDPSGMPPKKGTEDPKTPPDKKPGDNNSSTDMGMGSKTDPNMNPPKSEGKKGMNDTGMPMTGMSGSSMENTNPMPTAPQPRTPEEKQAEEKAKQVQEELNRNKGQGGDAKPNTSASADENRTEPAQPKPQPPQEGMGMDPQTKPEPKPADPKNPPPMGGDKNSASESKPEGNLEPKPNPDSSAKPGPQQPNPMQPKKPNEPAESRSEPLGGSPGDDKPQPKEGPKVDPKDPKNQNQDPMSGSGGKPSTDKPEPKEGDPAGAPVQKPDPTAKAAQPKPNPDSARGDDKNPTKSKAGPDEDNKPRPDPMAGDAKPERAPKSADAKPMPKNSDPMAAKPTETKPAPDMKTPGDPKSEGASETKPDTPKPPMPMGGGMSEKPVERGLDKPSETEQPPIAGNKNDLKEKLAGKDGTKGKADAKKTKELEDAVKDLTDPDPKKQQVARDKLDKEFGKDARQVIEQGEKERKAELDKLKKDLESPDKATREAAQKKLEDLKNKAEEMAKKDGKGGELTKEELKELTEKARDLNSTDDAKRQAAEKSFDDKVGKEAREKIQDEIKKREDQFKKDFGPKEKDDLQNKIDDIAKNTPGAGKGSIEKHNNIPGASSEPPKPAMEDDPRNRAKTAQLQLEEFEKNRYNHDLQAKLKWTQKEYDDFLEKQRKRVEEMAKEADAFEEALRNQPKSALPDAKFNIGGSTGKVESRDNGAKVDATGSGAVVPPPGFGGARDKFLKPKKP